MESKERICRALTTLVRETQYDQLCSKAEELGFRIDQTWRASTGEGFKCISARLEVDSEDVLVVAFRSTFGNEEWMEYPRKYWKRKFLVHDGQPIGSKWRLFALWSFTLDEVWNVAGDAQDGSTVDTVRGRIWRQLNAGKRVWLTGHSKGGAVATTAAARLLLGDSIDDRALTDPATGRSHDASDLTDKSSISRLSIFTFNAPLAFSAPLAQVYEEHLAKSGAQHVRVEHRSDRIRMLPAGEGLVHVGHLELRGQELTQDRGVVVGSAVAVAGIITALVSAGKAMVNSH